MKYKTGAPRGRLVAVRLFIHELDGQSLSTPRRYSMQSKIKSHETVNLTLSGIRYRQPWNGMVRGTLS
jgi:hypothetical protein